jgi:hypothetical protein
MKSFVEYQGVLDGKYNRTLSVHPLGAYVMARGGSYSTNQFADPTLSITVSHLKNFLEIIKSGRRQGFLELDIVVENELDVRVADKHLSLLQRVNLSRITPDTNTESWPHHWRMNVQYPELIYEQDVLRDVKSHTSLHKKYMNPLDVKSLQEGLAFQERMTLEQKHLLLRAIGLDDEPFICTDDVYG